MDKKVYKNWVSILCPNKNNKDPYSAINEKGNVIVDKCIYIEQDKKVPDFFHFIKSAEHYTEYDFENGIDIYHWLFNKDGIQIDNYYTYLDILDKEKLIIAQDISGWYLLLDFKGNVIAKDLWYYHLTGFSEGFMAIDSIIEPWWIDTKGIMHYASQDYFSIGNFNFWYALVYFKNDTYWLINKEWKFILKDYDFLETSWAYPLISFEKEWKKWLMNKDLKVVYTLNNTDDTIYIDSDGKFYLKNIKGEKTLININNFIY